MAIEPFLTLLTLRMEGFFIQGGQVTVPLYSYLTLPHENFNQTVESLTWNAEVIASYDLDSHHQTLEMLEIGSLEALMTLSG